MPIEPFTCPRCGAVSHNPNDIRARYCGACHWWTGHPVLGIVDPLSVAESEPAPARLRARTRIARWLRRPR